MISIYFPPTKEDSKSEGNDQGGKSTGVKAQSLPDPPTEAPKVPEPDSSSVKKRPRRDGDVEGDTKRQKVNNEAADDSQGTTAAEVQNAQPHKQDEDKNGLAVGGGGGFDVDEATADDNDEDDGDFTDDDGQATSSEGTDDSESIDEDEGIDEENNPANTTGLNPDDEQDLTTELRELIEDAENSESTNQPAKDYAAKYNLSAMKHETEDDTQDGQGVSKDNESQQEAKPIKDADKPAAEEKEDATTAAKTQHETEADKEAVGDNDETGHEDEAESK